MRFRALLSIVCAMLFSTCAFAQAAFAPGARTMRDSHNCYPYAGKWADRIDRALSHGTPVAIEQDLFWYTDPHTGVARSVLGHTANELTGNEPTMEDYFFRRVQPIVEAALRHPHPETWPLITLNLDIKTEEHAHLQAIWKELERHQDWLTTATNVADPSKVQPLHIGPILVLAGTSDNLEQVFRKEVPVGGQLLVFGAVHASADPALSPDQLETERASNYRRWWNVSWTAVEKGGASHAKAWTPALDSRVQQMVDHAHRQGLWIRFYTLDGVSPDELKANGWFSTYNFSSPEAVRLRWDSLYRAGTDYIASDEYEALADELARLRKPPATMRSKSIDTAAPQP